VAGIDEEPSAEAEAGALLEAEMAHDIHQLREAYFKVHEKG
jgi:hypothetical protein